MYPRRLSICHEVYYILTVVPRFLKHHFVNTTFFIRKCSWQNVHFIFAIRVLPHYWLNADGAFEFMNLLSLFFVEISLYLLLCTSKNYICGVFSTQFVSPFLLKESSSLCIYFPLNYFQKIRIAILNCVFTLSWPDSMPQTS